MPRSTKVVIVGGGGGVSASVAFNLLTGGGEFDVVMTDHRPEMARSHVLDLEQVLEQGARGTVREGGDDDIPQADILVVTAALPLTINDSLRLRTGVGRVLGVAPGRITAW